MELEDDGGAVGLRQDEREKPFSACLELDARMYGTETTCAPQELQSEEEERVWSRRMMEENEKQMDSAKMRERSLFSLSRMYGAETKVKVFASLG